MNDLLGPSEAQVEAAAEALERIVPNTDGVLWAHADDRTGELEPVTLAVAAGAALSAALPLIEADLRASIAGEIEAKIVWSSMTGYPSDQVGAAYQNAARIVRGAAR